jgi:hypothetical protein
MSMQKGVHPALEKPNLLQLRMSQTGQESALAGKTALSLASGFPE